MKIPDWLTRMIDGVPDGASIILSVEDVKGWLSENGSGGDQDLTRWGSSLIALRPRSEPGSEPDD